MAALPAIETDAAAIARSRRDPKAFAEIFDRHWPAIRAFAISRAGAAGEVFLMNWTAANHLDSRYFGPLPANSIVGRAAPLWTDEEE